MKRKRGGAAAIDWVAVRHRLELANRGGILSGEQARAVLEERARALARATQKQIVRELELVTFALGSERYGIETRHVVELAPLFDLTPLPGTPAHVAGVTNLRGEILPVFDLRRLLSVPQPALSDLSRLVVLGEVEAELAILAGGAQEIVDLGVDELFLAPESISGGGRGSIRGVTKEALIVLDGGVLLRDDRFFIDRNGSREAATGTR